jgi:phage tail sheath protein FI
VQVSYPGVYVEEFEPAAPIVPASTSVTGFVGVAAGGELKTPTLVTTFDQFQSTFGSRPLRGFYLWYALRGFFENGGKQAYIVRASNGEYARDVLRNTTPDAVPVLKVRARQPGVPDPQLNVSAVEAHRLVADKTLLFQPEANVAEVSVNGDPRTLRVSHEESNNQPFQPGDRVVRRNKDFPGAVVRSVSGDSIVLDRVLEGIAKDDKLYLANIQPNDTTIRLRYQDDSTKNRVPDDSLVPGTLLTLLKAGGDKITSEFVDSVRPEYAGKLTTYRVTFRENLGVSFTLDPGDGQLKAQSEEFSLTITPKDLPPKVYDRLAIDALHPYYGIKYVNDKDTTIRLDPVDPPPFVTDLTELLPLGTPGGITLGAGEDTPASDDVFPKGAKEDLSTLPDNPQPFLDALAALAKVSDVSLVAIPDAVAMKSIDERAAIQQAMVAHCENLADRFAVLDAFRPDQDPFASPSDENPSVEVQRGRLVSTRGYAALYYPWARVLPAGRGPLVSVPPCGHVCGLMARVDDRRGVHKAPANETLSGVVEITRDMSNDDQGILNLLNINVIRTFTFKGTPIVFGARTTASDANWNYVNVRRLFLFLEKSISRSLRSSVFEPNIPTLWGQLRHTISAFLLDQWHAGALFGDKADQAFYVKIDETNNPSNDRKLGKLTIEIGVQPAYPAEFIIVRIGIWDGGAEVSEG